MSKHGSSCGVISGLAARFNSQSEPLGGYTETVMPGAFRKSLAAGANIVCLVDHQQSQALGRTSSGTLRVWEDAVGLRFECNVSDSQPGRDAMVNIERGDLHQCSFAFLVEKDGERWTLGPDGDVRRELTNVSLHDVSAVGFPAYEETQVKVGI